MKSILEYIMLNYTWFLGGAIIILLAIIGSYADKTNFGQGKTKEKEEKEYDKSNIENIKKDDGEVVKEEITKGTPVINTEQKVKQQEVPVKKVENFEETFQKFDKEFNELLPKKEIIDGDLLDEIDSLSLDKTQKLKLTDIPDLDDVELPEIKSLEPEDKDIWKF